jgi:hypothetical protein
MRLLLVLLILISICLLACESSLCSPRYRPKYLRRFSIIYIQPKTKMAKTCELLERCLKELEKRKFEIETAERLKEEEARRKIYKQHLLPYERGSSVLRDFQTNRF